MNKIITTPAFCQNDIIHACGGGRHDYSHAQIKKGHECYCCIVTVLFSKLFMVLNYQ